MRLTHIDAGEIVTTHGLRGDVKVLPWGDSPEFLQNFKRVSIEGKTYEVEACRVQKGCDLLKLRGVDTCEDGMALKGKTVSVFREDTDPETIFADELLHMEVFCGQDKIGEITDVLDYPGNLVYEVTGEHEYLIPAVKEFVLSADLDANRMEVRLLEGMRSDED